MWRSLVYLTLRVRFAEQEKGRKIWEKLENIIKKNKTNTTKTTTKRVYVANIARMDVHWSKNLSDGRGR